MEQVIKIKFMSIMMEYVIKMIIRNFNVDNDGIYIYYVIKMVINFYVDDNAWNRT